MTTIFMGIFNGTTRGIFNGIMEQYHKQRKLLSKSEKYVISLNIVSTNTIVFIWNLAVEKSRAIFIA